MVNRIAIALKRGPRKDVGERQLQPQEGRPIQVRPRRRLPSRRALIVGAVAGLLALAAIAKGVAGGGVPVETGRVERGTLRVTVSGTGKSQVRERHVISAPVAGQLQRIRLLPGDPVQVGQVLAVIDAAAPRPLDARSRAEQQARLTTALAAEAGARASVERAHAAELAAQDSWERAQRLSREGAMATKDLEAAELDRRSRAAERGMAEASARQSRGEVEAARATLASLGATRSGGVAVVSPVDGTVLRVVQESEGVVQAGAPIIEVGDLKDMEVALDMLTTDAVRVPVGAPVEIRHWGGGQALPGKVRRVDPSGFTKVSALGVEEQRTYVVVDPVTEGAWPGLADGYHVEAEIVVAERPGALLVPVASLVRGQDGWSVFVVESGRSRLKPVRIGEMGSDRAEVASGLAEGDQVLLYPGEQIRDGVRVRAEVTRR